tara:strand:+ start:93 stop:467 length:375 start_codon:yes stop_codon:yes gene_type:complete
MNICVEIDNNSDKNNELVNEFAKQIKIRKNEMFLHPTCEEYIQRCIECSIHSVCARKMINKYNIVTKDDEKYSCTFCFRKFLKNQHKTKLPCNHVFHRTCVNEFVFKLNMYECPICDSSIYSDV